MAVDCCSFDQTNELKVKNYEYKDEHEDVDVDEDEDEDEYIDMEVSSFTYDFKSHQIHGEFEFQMSSKNVIEKESTTSPADELFYKGKLLPLHLPPRLQLVEKLLLKDPITLSHIGTMNHIYSTPLGTNSATTPTENNTPFQSCNISPSESCHVSRELNAEDYFRDFTSYDDDALTKSSECDNSNNNNNTNKKSWTRKLKTKIKSLFGKSSGCSYENSALCSVAEKQIKGTKKHSFGHFPRRENEGVNNNNNNNEGKIFHRRSFSGAFKRRTSIITTASVNPSNSSTCSSSSSMNACGNSAINVVNDAQFLKRTSSASSEMETSLIQGAIAHCKQSQQPFRIMRKTMSEIGVHSLDDQTRLNNGICRG